MKRLKFVALALALAAVMGEVMAANEQRLFDFDWKFSRGECAEAEKPQFNDSKWESVELPHDWSIEGPYSKEAPAFSRGAWLPAGKGAYRKKFNLTKSEAEGRVEIHFEGVYRNSEVWINGQYLGIRPFGFISFNYDMSPYVKAGENVITVKVDNSSQPGSRWYTGSGIYRHVYLNLSDKLYIPTWGNYIVANKVESDGAGVVEFATTVKNDNVKGAKSYAIRYTITDAEGKVVATQTTEKGSVDAGKSVVDKSTLKVGEAKLWDGIKSPYLYNTTTEILDGKKVIYKESAKVGIRTMEYCADRGFILNGNVTKLEGMCLHHDGGALGAAVYRRTIERQLEILRDMGCNAIRLAHNPYSEEFLQVCDEMGFLVMAEIFDEWKTAKAPSIFENGDKGNLPVDFYAKHFDEWSDRDIRNALLHDRSHPSIFMWSIGNEIHEMKSDDGYPIGKRLSAIVHELDYRPTTNGVNGYGWDAWPSEKAVSTSDVRGYNYIKAKGFNIERAAAPKDMAIVTECSAVQSFYPRGMHIFGKKRDEFMDKLGYTGKWAYSELESNKLFRKDGLEAIRTVKERPHIMGMFVWTGFDYLGEVTPFGWPARSSSFAPIDLCGFPKDGYYIYQSQWSDEPMVYLYPHWNFEGQEGESIPLTCFSNCDEVELLVNGFSYGRVKIDVGGVDYAQWHVPYAPGEVKVLAYKKKVKAPVAEMTIRTAGEAAAVKVSADSETMVANSQDLIYLECDVVDKDGNFVPTADNMLEFKVSGAATLVGVDNGDNMSHQSFKGDKVTAFSGKALAIIKSTHAAGDITVTVSSKGLKPATLKFKSSK